MHAKTDSEVTSLAASSPPRSPRRPIYYVMSPSHPDAEKMSLGGSTPGGSPVHHHHHYHHHPHHHRYASSPIHHSRESSTTRFSASLKHAYWRKIPVAGRHPSDAGDADDDSDADDYPATTPVRCYVVWFLLGFIFLFTLFSLILWGASKPYKPEISIKSVVFESYNIQAGMDLTGVPTKMLSINSTVKIAFRNPATFFGVHVSSTPLVLYYYDLKIASGNMKEFYESRKSGRVVRIDVIGRQIPLYGGGSSLSSRSEGGPSAVVPLELTFVMRARAHILGKLVKSKFYRRVHCSLTLRENRLGKHLHLKDACQYHD
ncbi:uncharacterized protein [Elaeis guineensis]|uniref:Uncharacterized protein LOC105042627 n=1 Tax=Elaeis guineensis var. tenera TaxID=51953 RepID=A0A6I9R0G7_ELAGV|nr:uncharacterized protein LOC105042627 [Elaeis guineensis]